MVEIYNNTFYANGSENYPTFYSTSSKGTVFKNNLVFSVNSDYFHDTMGTAWENTTMSEYNLYYSLNNQHTWKWGALQFTDLNSYYSASGNDQSGLSVVADPLLADPSNSDFHLLPESPAIDAGIDVGLVKDFDDNSVPFGAVPDIGAYEACNDNDGDGYAINGGLCGLVDIDDSDPSIYTINDLSAREQKKKIKLQWTCVPEVGAYNVYRIASQEGMYELIAENHQTDGCNYFDNDITKGTTYSYIIRWVNTDGYESADSNDASTML
jgi:hypothetical protein